MYLCVQPVGCFSHALNVFDLFPRVVVQLWMFFVSVKPDFDFPCSGVNVIVIFIVLMTLDWIYLSAKVILLLTIFDIHVVF